MYQKFIINQDGVLKFGTVYLHRDLLAPGEKCVYGGGLWRIDHSRGAIVLYGRSFDFGTPDFDYVRRIDWSGVGGQPHPLLYLPKWPDETLARPVFAQREEEKLKVLLTGAHGFLGSRTAWYLKEKCGYTVYAPSHQVMDITDADACIGFLSDVKPDFVVHCAAISSTAYCQKHPEASREVNIEGTCHVIAAAALHGARCIYMSSDQVYQTETNDWRQTFREEDTDLEHYLPRGVYGRDKLQMEMNVRQMDSSAIGLRLTWMYDSKAFSSMPDCPTQLKADHGIMANLAKAEKEGIPVKACTRERRGVTDVWDVVRVLARIIGQKGIAGGIYNCGETCRATTYERYLQLAEMRGIDRSLIIPDDTWSRSLAMDTSKLSKALHA